jgi:DNA repair exonuclease SbcCD ATPase subunit
LVWQQIEALLTQPEVVLAGLKTRVDNAKEASHLEGELAEVNKRLKALDKEHQQLLQWALKGFPEETVVAENKRLNEQRAILEQRKSELETRIEQAKETEVDMECIERFCELVRQNLRDFTFDDKRLALEALSIKVFVDGNSINIEGAIPIAGDDIVSATPRCSELGRVKVDS